ncbi:hypothetical protein JCM10207_001255 [Rhodosporidiobolus poonsookiae]
MLPLEATTNDPNATKPHESAEEERNRTLAEKRVVRKLDCILMPVLLISFGLQYLDKAVMGSAAVFGLIKDLDLSTTHVNAAGKTVTSTLRYSTASSSFYWGYIVAVLPFALLLQRVPLAKTLSLLILLWGITAILTVVCHSYEGIVVQRVFLGVLESSVSPGFVMITNMWYKKSEQAARLGIWYSATGIFSSFSGLVNYGLGSAGGPSPWKYMYYFAGGWTILWAFVILLVVPDSPRTSGRWFNDDERAILIRRSRENLSGRVELGRFEWSQAKEAALDVKLYVFLLMGAGIYVCNGAVTAFATIIIKSFGYSSLQTIALSVPGGIFTAVFIYFFTFLSSKWKNGLTYLIPISCIPVFIGAAIIWGASWEHRGVPLFGFYLLPTFGSPYVLLLALASANVAGSTKKAISSGAIFVGYCVGNIIGPYTVFSEEKAVKYRSTWIALYVSLGVVCICSLLLRVLLARENAQRDARALASGQALDKSEKRDGDASTMAPTMQTEEEREAEQERVEREDLTDKRNGRFRYTL